MTQIEKIKQQELDKFKVQSMESAQSSFCNSLTFFMFSQWLKDNYESDKDKQAVKDSVFKEWSGQIIKASHPIFNDINTVLSAPQRRWTNIITGARISTEDYQEKFNEALKTIRESFNKLGQ